MTEPGVVLDDGTMRLEFLRTDDQTDGELHEMRARYVPRSPWAPPHHHPAQEERFRVLEGRMSFRVDGTLRVVPAGDEIVIPPGSVHRARNAGDVPVTAIWQTRPALRTAEFFQAIHAAQTRGTLLEQALVVDAFPDVFRLAVPPRPLTNAGVRALVALARLTGRTMPRS